MTTMSATAQLAQEASSYYTLLLHSLSHEHNAGNFDRHSLLLEKWARDFCEGFFIRDLEHILAVFAVLRFRLESHPHLFREVLSSVLKVCSLPLFEVKANERLRQNSVDIIKEYMYDVCRFWVHGDALRNAEITKCFRCMVNGGTDPTVLKVDLKKWSSPDGLKVQVTDRIYLQKQLRDSGAVDFLVDAFNASSELYRQDALSKLGTLLPVGVVVNNEPEASTNPRMTMNADDSDNENDNNNNNNDNENVYEPEASIAASSSTVTGGDLAGSVAEAAKQALADSQELCKILTTLCIELTEDAKTACAMCVRGVSDGAVRLLDVGSRINLRDASITSNVDLIWTVVDSYLQQAQPPSLANDAYLQELLSNSQVMDFEKAVGVLIRIFLMLLHEGYRLADKECRNEILVVISMIASFPASFPAFMCSDALNILITYSCVSEMGQKAWPFYTKPLARLRNFASISDIDLQLKRTMWMTVTEVLRSSDADALLCTASSPIIDMLMAYVEFDTMETFSKQHHASSLEEESATLPSRLRGGSSVMFNNNSQTITNTAESTEGPLGFNPSVSTSIHQGASLFDAAPIPAPSAQQQNITQVFLHSLPIAQLRELQVLAMTFLAENAPKMMGEYLRIGGPVRVLDVLFRYSRSTLVEHKALVYSALLLLNRCLICSDVVKRLMELENGCQTFMYIFQHTDEDKTKALSARLVAILCSDHNELCQQQVRVKNGIQLLVGVVSAYATHRKVKVGKRAHVKQANAGGADDGDSLTNDDDNSGDVGLIIVAALDCISKVVVGNRRSEAQFCKDEGVDSLLLLLEVSPFILRTQVLRLLADLFDNKQLLTFIHAWRSPKTMRSATQLFAHCWMDEEARLGVMRERGIICDIWNPLGNHDWPIDDVNQVDGESLSSGSAASARSLAVTRLTEAITLSRGHHGVIPEQILRQVLESDTRGIVAHILHLIGAIDSYANALAPDFRISFYLQNGGEGGYEQGGSPTNHSEASPEEKREGADEGYGNGASGVEEEDERSPPRIVATGGNSLHPADKQVVAIAQQYHLLRSGEWWRSVMEQLRDETVKPIEADLALIEARIGASFDAAFIVQTEQMELHAQEVGLGQHSESEYNSSILAKKAAQIKAGYLRKHGSRRM